MKYFILIFLMLTPLLAQSNITDRFTKVTTGSLNKSLAQTILDGDIISNHKSVAPNLGDILKWNGTIWENTPFVAPSGASLVTLYLDDTASDIGGYVTLTTSPAGGTEVQDQITVSSATSPVLGESYATPTGGIGGTSIEGGTWIFNIWAFVDSTTGVTKIQLRTYKRTAGGTETLLFTVDTAEINNVTGIPQLYETRTVQPSFSTNATDRIVIKVYGTTTSGTSRQITFSHNGTDHYSSVTTPLVTRHNSLAGLNEGDYRHSTAAEYTGTGTGVFAREDSPTFTTKITTPRVAGGNSNIISKNLELIANEGTQTGSIIVKSAMEFDAYMGLSFKGSTSGSVTLNAPAVAGTTTLTLPASSGTANQVMKSDGSNNLGWMTLISGTTFTGTSLTLSTSPIQKHTYNGSSAQTFSSTGFGSNISTIADGTIIILVGTSDTNTLTINVNDASNGWLINGTAILKKGVVIAFIKDATLARMVEIARSL